MYKLKLTNDGEKNILFISKDFVRVKPMLFTKKEVDNFIKNVQDEIKNCIEMVKELEILKHELKD